MIYELLIILIIMMLISYSFCGKDFFAPATMLLIGFIFSVLSAIYNLRLWKFTLSSFTVAIVVSALALSVVINATIHHVVQKTNFVLKKMEESKINRKITVCVLILQLFVVAIMLQQVRRIGGSGSLASVMVLYRAKTAYGTNLSDQLPGWIRQLLNFSSVLSYIYLYNIFQFYKSMKRRELIGCILVPVISSIASLLTGGRFATMALIVGAMVMWCLVRIKRTGMQRVFRIRTIIAFVVVGILAMYLFWVSKNLVGRTGDSDILSYITHYSGGSIPGLDLYFKNPPSKSYIWGKETFYSLNNGLRKLGVLDIPYYYIHHEFRQSGGISIGNVYTALRDYHYDFGTFGLFFLHFVFSACISTLYEVEKKRHSTIGIMLNGILYQCVVFYTVSNYFFATFVGFGFLIKLVMLVILYELLIRKRVKVTCRVGKYH